VAGEWRREDGLALVSEDQARVLGEHWERGWNELDIDVIMAPLASDVVFRSPFVPRISGDPAVSAIVGYEAVKQYMAGSFTRATQGLRYTLDATYVAPDSVVLLYRVHRPDGTDRAGADTMVLGADGLVHEWRSHYPFG
jgi:hypothetical protein